MVLGPWDRQLSDRVSGTEVRGLLHSSVTSGLSWRMATLGLSVLWQRGVVRSQLSLGAPGSQGQGRRVCGGIRQTDRHTDSPSLLPPPQHCPLKQGRGKREMRREESHLLSFTHSHGITVDVTPAHTGVHTNTLVLQQIGKGSQFTAGWGEMTRLHSTCQGLEYRASTHKRKEKPSCHNPGRASIQGADSGVKKNDAVTLLFA